MLWDDAGAEAHRGDVKTELDEEGDDVSEIAIFDVQCGDPKAWPEGGEEGEDDKNGKEADLPAGKESVIEHHPGEDDEADEEVDKRDDDGGGGDDEPGKIDFADQVGVADETVGGFGQSSGKERPG